jgi:flagellar protein FlaG
MVTHVALQKLPANLTELRTQRTASAAYSNTAEATAPHTLDQAQSAPVAVPPVDAKMLEKAVKDLSQGVQNLQRSLQFSIDESSGRTVIKVVDKDTQEVIRQIPEEQVLELAARLDKVAGVFVQDEA